MHARPRSYAVMLAIALPIAAQQGAAIFHHFHRYPATGQYTTRSEGSIGGTPAAAPVTQTACIAAPTGAQVAAAINGGNSAGAVQNCTMRILRDEEKVAEGEQTCQIGPRSQVTHLTMTAVDDQTFREDTVSVVGDHKITAHSTVHYDGLCTAAQLAESSKVSMPKPTAEECAEYAASKKELAKSSTSCDDVPAPYKATCTKNLEAASATLNQMLAACAK